MANIVNIEELCLKYMFESFYCPFSYSINANDKYILYVFIAAFLIPLFEKLHINKTAIGSTTKFPRALILSPTRELAMQTVKFFREIGRFVNLKVATILGGDSMENQFQVIHDKPDVVIATPGRFMHLCVEMEMKLDGVEYVVFDEADRYVIY